MTSLDSRRALPDYPKFIALGDLGLTELRSLTGPLHPPYSDWNGVSLWTWDVNEDAALAHFDGHLVLRMRDYHSGEPIWWLHGSSSQTSAVAAAVFGDLAEQEGTSAQLELVPAETAKPLADNCVVTDQRDQADYIVSPQLISQAVGREWTELRQKYNRFARRFEPRFIISALTDKATREAIDQLTTAWLASTRQSPADTEVEIGAIDRLLRAHSQLADLTVFLVQAEGRWVAFAVAERLNYNWALWHFQKTHPGFADATAYIHREAARYLAGAGVRYWNMEQDLGVAGLRYAKERYRPIEMLRKFTVRPAAPLSLE